MATGGITFGAAKDSLRLVCDNGVGVTDPRVMRRTNEAIQEILSSRHPDTGGMLVPVNGAMTADVVSDINFNLLLPPEMENAIALFVKPPGTGLSNPDVSQSWYDITAPFAFVDPAAHKDNPLKDLGLVPDVNDPSILRRKYHYPGLSGIATVVITGKKRYRPITSDTDYLIVQNVPAVKLLIQSIECRENRDMDNALKYKAEAIRMIADEAAQHLMDPRDTMGRKGDYELDLINFKRGSFGWIRARLALEVPGGLMQGRSEMTRILERSEMRLMEMGTWKNCMEEFDATIVGGHVYFPARVESLLAITICGQPQPIRSIFFKYLENGPGSWDCSCGGRFEDEGEEYFPEADNRRRKYKALIGEEGQSMLAICKLRWVPKAPDEQMTIVNLEAHRLMVGAILMEQAEKWNEALVGAKTAKGVLDDELKEYLRGVKHTLPISIDSVGMSGIGSDML